MTINMHGLPLNHLESASQNTVNWPAQSGWHTQIFYDTETGDIFTRDQLGESWTVFRDPAVILVCNTTRHMSQQAISDAIFSAVEQHKEISAWYEGYLKEKEEWMRQWG